MMSRGKLVKQIVTWLICVAMVLVSMNFSVAVNEVKAAAKTNYLTFTADGERSSVTFKYNSGTAKYSTDNGTTWVDCPSGTKITLKASKSVCFKGTNVTTDKDNHFSMTGTIKASGSVTSLTDGKGTDPNVTLTERCYYYMFGDCTSLTQAPELPATELAKECYSYMFYLCDILTQAPELPATELAEACYAYMFRECINLTQAPELPATTLKEFCYCRMFEDCISLTQAPELSAKTMKPGCYKEMFSGCASLTQAPELPATELAEDCYDSMFWDCISLIQAPKLPAKTLESGCYYGMFADCTSLTQSPKLPATTMKDYCYARMFYGCTSLVEPPKLPATELARYCYEEMFYNTSIVIKTESDSKYHEEWKIPATASANNWNQLMFSDLTPELNTVYYVYGHNVVSEVKEGLEGQCKVKETCTTEGEYYRYCTGCDKLSTNTFKVPATGHTEVVDSAVPATVTSTGLTEGSHCSGCGIVLVEQQVIPKLSPTVRPTAVPTNAPTSIPTSTPKPMATLVPTVDPTVIPTKVPTTEPTRTPIATVAPTKVPTTPATTAEPTAIPTNIPIATVAPTKVPTNPATTAKPTAKPTNIPVATVAPTKVPTTPATTAKPTAKPTNIPVATVAPTMTPSTTAKPSAKPTSVPTSKPTMAPETDNGVEGFIERLYTVAMGRDFDKAGKDYWVNEIKVNGQNGAEVALQFLYSPEFLKMDMSEDDFITILYRTFFDREPEPAGLEYWKGEMSVGKSKEWVIAGFINSPEWANICLTYGIKSGTDVQPTITIVPNEQVIGFATRLYTTCLNREFDPAGLDYWAKELANLRQSGSQVAKGFFFSQEFINLNLSNEEYVTRLYKTFMGREPEKAGFDYWVGQLNDVASRESVFDGFSAAPEFGDICAEAGIFR